MPLPIELVKAQLKVWEYKCVLIVGNTHWPYAYKTTETYTFEYAMLTSSPHKMKLFWLIMLTRILFLTCMSKWRQPTKSHRIRSLISWTNLFLLGPSWSYIVYRIRYRMRYRIRYLCRVFVIIITRDMMTEDIVHRYRIDIVLRYRMRYLYDAISYAISYAI